MVIDTKQCFACEATIDERAEICPKCGVRQRVYKSKTVAGLLGVFFGGLGLHWFYIGTAWKGLTDLIPTILLLIFLPPLAWLPAFFALLRGIGFLLMSKEGFARKYCGK